jgi:hypothetical protein
LRDLVMNNKSSMRLKAFGWNLIFLFMYRCFVGENHLERSAGGLVLL